MELAHLETFAAVYRTGNLTRAAEELHLSQPAISSHLKSLETAFGRPLFVRLHRGVTPTPFAHNLAQEVEAPLQTLRAVATGTPKTADNATGVLFVGGPADALSALVLPALGPLIDRGVRVTVRFGTPRELVAAVGDRELDLAIATTPTRHRSVDMLALYEESLLVVASPRLGITIHDVTRTNGAVLNDIPLISFAASAPLARRYWRDAFAKTAPRPSVIVEDLRAVVELVRTGHGWSVLPDYLVREPLAGAQLRLLHRPLRTPSNMLYLAVPAARHQSPTVQAAVTALRTAAADW